MNLRPNVYLFLIILLPFFSCKKNDGTDFRDKFVGEYDFTKSTGNHNGEYVWESGDNGDPLEIWHETHSETIVWQSIGSVEKSLNKNRLLIDYGNGEKFKVEVSPSGAISCISSDCDDMQDPPFSAESNWSFSALAEYYGGPLNWNDVNYYLDLGNTIGPNGLPYGGWSYSDWRIYGKKL